MKVNGPSGVGAPAGSGKARPAGAVGGFSLPTPAVPSTPAAAPTGGLGNIASVGALLALQDVGGPLERKRRSVGRAGRILDVLDILKHALLGGEMGAADIESLRSAVRDERLQTDDPGLEAVLDEIETRAAVEIAKLEQAARRA